MSRLLRIPAGSSTETRRCWGLSSPCQEPILWVMTGIRHCPRCQLRFSTASELEHHRRPGASPLMAWLPDWMAALGSHGAARNAARAIDGPRAAALAVEHQLAALAPLGARSLAGPAPAEQPPLSPPAATHGTRAATPDTPGRPVEQPEVLASRS